MQSRLNFGKRLPFCLVGISTTLYAISICTSVSKKTSGRYLHPRILRVHHLDFAPPVPAAKRRKSAPHPQAELHSGQPTVVTVAESSQNRHATCSRVNQCSPGFSPVLASPGPRVPQWSPCVTRLTIVKLSGRLRPSPSNAHGLNKARSTLSVFFAPLSKCFHKDQAQPRCAAAAADSVVYLLCLAVVAGSPF